MHTYIIIIVTSKLRIFNTKSKYLNDSFMGDSSFVSIIVIDRASKVNKSNDEPALNKSNMRLRSIFGVI